MDDDANHDGNEKCELCLPETETEGKEQGLVTQYPRKAVKKAPREEGTFGQVLCTSMVTLLIVLSARSAA